MNYDDLLDATGGFGRFQVIMTFLLAFFTFQAGLENEILVVSLYQQQFQCVTNSSDKCYISNKSDGTYPCTNWRYSRDDMQETLVTEYNLVCDNKFWINMIYNIHTIGRCLAGMCGILVDLVGRRPIIFMSIIIHTIYIFVVPFIESFNGQLIVRLLEGTTSLLTHVGLVLAIEIVPRQYRGWVACCYYTPFAFGYMFAAFLSYYGQTWRRVYFMSAFVSIINIPLFFLYPESPRWLLVKGRFKEARKVIEKIATINKIELPHNVLDSIRVEDNERKEPFYLLFNQRTILIRTMFIILGYWSLCMSYYGVAIDLHFASRNIFINIALMGLMELPAGTLTAVVTNRYGRRLSFTVFATTTVICLTTVPFLPLTGHQQIIRSVVALLGKFALATTFHVTDVWYPELFPTSLRTSSICFLNFVGAVAVLLAPYVVDLNTSFLASSGLIFSFQLSICIVGCLKFFPETANLPLPDIAEDSNSLYRGNENRWKVNMAKRTITPMDETDTQLLLDKLEDL